MKKIRLTQGQFALVDDDDYEKVSKIKWCAGVVKEGNFYAKGSITLDNGEKRLELMHRFILGLEKGDGLVVDHIDRNTLNNGRKNLRICTVSENNMNKRKLSSRKLPRGVYYYKATGKYIARIKIMYKEIHIGSFKSISSAKRAYIEASKKYHGKFSIYS